MKKKHDKELVATRQQMRELQPKSKKKRRPCLGGCDTSFLSRGPDNRVCPKCTRKNKDNRLPNMHHVSGGDAA